MNQISAVLRRVKGGYAHWCPACEEMHVIPDRWQFNGNAERPTFTPSVKITGIKTIKKNGEWTGGWERDANGNTVPDCCHYFITDGSIMFQGDCLHTYAGVTVQMSPIPDFVKDDVP